MLISVHLPKTAGISFAKSLETHFGSAFLRDYADKPINISAYQRNLNAIRANLEVVDRDLSQVACIHGHFLPLKYLLLSLKTETRFVTWMRDPVERMASHYVYWLSHYNPKNPPPLHKRVVEEKWSLERFCLGAELQNFYGQFLSGFPIERFDFIGIVEHYDEDFPRFCERFLGQSLPVYRENVSARPDDRVPHIQDPGLRKAIEEHHREDMELYHRVLERRQAARSEEKAA